MVSFRLGTAICVVFLLTSSVEAQRRGNNAAFERSSPAVGELLPDVTAFDADGKPFPLRSIKDNYSVIVFGCLT